MVFSASIIQSLAYAFIVKIHSYDFRYLFSGVSLCVGVMLRTKPRTLHMLHKCSISELTALLLCSLADYNLKGYICLFSLTPVFTDLF